MTSLQTPYCQTPLSDLLGSYQGSSDPSIRWADVAPAKTSHRKAVADLEYCIPNSKRKNYRVIKRGSRWFIQHGKIQ